MFGPAPQIPADSVPVDAVDAAAQVELDPVSLILHASGPVFVVVWLLAAAAAAVWLIAVLKLLQLRRWSAAEQRFEAAIAQAASSEELFDLAARFRDAPGSRIVQALDARRGEPRVLASVAKRALVTEQKHASGLMPLLASIGSASPFIGLFGTVWGIMDAFLRIGREKSASLPVVAPAIGEALIATAIGLFAAIPAVIAYNAIAKRLEDLLSGLEASAEGWVALAGGGPVTQDTHPAPDPVRGSARGGAGRGDRAHEPPAGGGRGSDRPREAARVSDRPLQLMPEHAARMASPEAAERLAAVMRGGSGTQVGGSATPLPPPEPLATRREDPRPGASWPPPNPFGSRAAEPAATAGHAGAERQGALQQTPASASIPLVGRALDPAPGAPPAAGPGGTRMGPPPLPRS